MTYQMLNLNDITAALNTPFAHGLAALLAVGALLLVLAKVRSAVHASAYRTRQAPRLSKGALRQLEKEGIKPVIRRQNQSYRGTAYRRYEYR